MTTIYLVGNGIGALSPASTGTWTVECWGAGAAGSGGNGGAGGSYSKITGFSATSGTPVAFTLGAPGTSGGQGGDTWFSSTVTVLAPGGGSSTTAVGTVKNAGGVSSFAITSAGSGAGAGGPSGVGSAGARGSASAADGSGGSGSNGGTSGAVSSISGTGGRGGSSAGTGGAGGTSGGAGAAGSLGSGGGGGSHVTTGTGGAGGKGGDDYDHGGGGGGGSGNGPTNGAGGAGGTPGGGGGGSLSSTGGQGGWGLIRLTYASTDASAILILGSITSIQIPTFWTTTATGECWGGGGGGISGTATSGGGGGGGGAYSAGSVTVTPGGTLTVSVGAGGVGGTTTTATSGANSTIASTTIVASAGAKSGSQVASGAGGLAVTSTGTTKFNGGGGGLSAAAAADVGGGGGGAAGSVGVGTVGVSGTTTVTTGAGGSGNNGSGGAGGATAGATNTVGRVGVSHSLGGGGGSGSGGSSTGKVGGNGGWPGSGGAGGGGGSTTNTGGSGAAGLVRLSQTGPFTYPMTLKATNYQGNTFSTEYTNEFGPNSVFVRAQRLNTFVGKVSTSESPLLKKSYGKTATAFNRNSNRIIRLVNKLLPTASQQTISRVFGFRLSSHAASAEVSFLARVIGIARSAKTIQNAARRLNTAISEYAISAQVMSLVRTAAVSIVRRAFQGEALSRALGISRTLRGTGGQIAALGRLLSLSVRASVASPNSANTLFSRAFLRLFLVTSASSARLSNLVFVSLRTFSGQVASGSRIIGIARVISEVQVVSWRVSVSISRQTVDNSIVAIVRLLSTIRAFGVANSQSTALTRSIPIARGLTDPSAAGLQRGLGMLRVTSTTQVVRRVLSVSIIRGASNGMASATAMLRASGRMLGAAITQVASLVRATPVIRGAIDATVVSYRIGVLVSCGISQQQTSRRTILVSLARGVSGAMAASRTLLVLMQRIVGSAETTSSNRGVGRSKTLAAIQAQALSFATFFNHAGVNNQIAFNAFGGQAAKTFRSIGLPRSASSGESVSNSRFVAGIRLLAVASTQSIGLRRVVAKILQVFGSGPGSPQSASQILGTSLSRGATSPESTARLFSLAVVRSIITAQAPNVKRLVGAIRSLASAQIISRPLARVSIARATISTQLAASLQGHSGFVNSLAMSVFGAQAANLRRSAAIVRSVASGQAVRLVRLVNTSLHATASQAQARALTVAKRLSVTALEAPALIRLRAILLLLATTSAESPTLRTTGYRSVVASVASGSSARLGRLVAIVRATFNGMVAFRNSININLHLPADPLQVVGIGVRLTRGLSLIAKQVQALSVALDHGIGFLTHLSVGTSSSGVAALSKGLIRTFTVLQPSVVSIRSLYFKFFPVGQRRRVVRLPDPQLFTALPPAARGVTLPDAQLLVALPPAVRRVIVPKQGDDDMSDYEIQNAEPAYFSPLDPTDTDIFTFDWSRRSFPNDIIVFASIVSVPTGVNLIGPAFVSGLAVSITVGPFDIVPPLPATYSLRCMAMFASGRISNYSVPFDVMTL